MRKGFTLIELMIVIAIIAIIAAIAVPNLLESRITANESAAATSLKSGIFPAQVQFQAGGYVDNDSDGVGEYTDAHQYLAGAAGGGAAFEPATGLQLLGADWNAADQSEIGGYDYELQNNGNAGQPNIDASERYWVGAAGPAEFGDTGRRAFVISQQGLVGASAGARLTEDDTAIAEVALDCTNGGTSNGAAVWQDSTDKAIDGTAAQGTFIVAEYVPYKK
ncbi:MAG: prepilin-type N-terminal cleavage/methylation domain-containing protein [Planctomycetota bacterium]